MKTFKYTLILPAYKGCFLDEMLRSIQEQTYENFKVIISDDCSPEDLYSICKPYLDDPRFSYRRNEKNMGREDLVAHWNLLVNMCDSEYLILASDDDVYHSCFLFEIDRLVKTYPQVGLFHARACKIDRNGDVFQNDSLYEEFQSQIDYVGNFANPQNILCVANYVYKTSILKNIGGFKSYPLAWKSDSATNIQMAKHGICNTSKILFSFRLSGINITSKGQGDRKMSLAKLNACHQFYVWFRDYQVTLLPMNRIEENTLDRIRSMYKGKLLGEMMGYYLYTNFRQFCSLYKFFKNEGALPNRYRRVTFVVYWVKTKLKNL